MKKVLLLVALLVAALVGNAQIKEPTYVPADSVSVLLRHLQNTNSELVRVNENLTAHAAMVGVGGAAELFGFVLMVQAAKSPEAAKQGKYRTGLAFCIGGAILTAGSFIPLAKNKVRLDANGLVIHPSEFKKK